MLRVASSLGLFKLRWQAPEQLSETQTVLKPSQHAITLLIWIPFHVRINRMDSLDVLWDLLRLGSLGQIPDLIIVQDLHDLQAQEPLDIPTMQAWYEICTQTLLKKSSLASCASPFLISMHLVMSIRSQLACPAALACCIHLNQHCTICADCALMLVRGVLPW